MGLLSRIKVLGRKNKSIATDVKVCGRKILPAGALLTLFRSSTKVFKSLLARRRTTSQAYSARYAHSTSVFRTSPYLHRLSPALIPPPNETFLSSFGMPLIVLKS